MSTFLSYLGPGPYVCPATHPRSPCGDRAPPVLGLGKEQQPYHHVRSLRLSVFRFILTHPCDGLTTSRPPLANLNVELSFPAVFASTFPLQRSEFGVRRSWFHPQPVTLEGGSGGHQASAAACRRGTTGVVPSTLPSPLCPAFILVPTPPSSTPPEPSRSLPCPRS